MKISLTIFVIISIFIARKIFDLKIEKHKYLIFIMPFSILCLTQLRFLFDDISCFLIFLNVFAFFVGSIVIILMFKLNKLRFKSSKDLRSKFYNFLKIEDWIEQIFYSGYFIIQMLIIWKGGDFIFIK